MKRLLSEPLAHFLMIGAALFVVWIAFGDATGPYSRRIVVSAAQIEHLATGFERTWLRPPTAEELEPLVRDFVREEVLYREAVAMGLDRDDTIVRRRLRQKMEFVTDDLSRDAPGEGDLQAYLDEHAESYRTEPLLAFRQVYISRDRHGAAAPREARRVLAALRAPARAVDVEALGDPLMLPRLYGPTPRADIVRQFGGSFAEGLLAAPLQHWTGPVESGYGLHLVFVDDRIDGHVPALSVVRQRVEQDWRGDRRRDRNDEMYRRLLAQYVVTIETPVTSNRNGDRR